LIRRANRGNWRSDTPPGDAKPSSYAAAVLATLSRQGACFFDEVIQGSGLLKTQVEMGLSELVARGIATADSFAGLRALLTPSDRRPPIRGRSRRSKAVFGMENAGRWSLLPSANRDETASGLDLRNEEIVRALLQRYGVVFRRLLDRENALPPWRDLLPVLRRMEARGDLRGGRFVDGFTGEQFALPEALARMRAIRKDPPTETWFSISAADPLNLSGIVLPGRRIPATTGNRLLLRDGEAIAVSEGGEVRFLVDLPPTERWEAQNALLRRRVPPQLRAYLGRPA